MTLDLEALKELAGRATEDGDLEAIADAIDLARYVHPRARPWPFSQAGVSDRTYAFRLAKAACDAMGSDFNEEREISSHWRKLAHQFDMHRIDAMSMLRGVVAGTVTRADVQAFLAQPPRAALSPTPPADKEG